MSHAQKNVATITDLKTSSSPPPPQHFNFNTPSTFNVSPSNTPTTTSDTSSQQPDSESKNDGAVGSNDRFVGLEEYINEQSRFRSSLSTALSTTSLLFSEGVQSVKSKFIDSPTFDDSLFPNHARHPYATTVAQQLESDYQEIWIRATSRKTKKLLVYLVPGNPGVLKAYKSFVYNLCVRLNADGCIAGHLGHCTFSREVYGLQTQVSHHKKLLKKHSTNYRGIIILGHSIGGYITLQLDDLLEDLREKLKAIGLLAPTLSRFRNVSYWPLKLISLRPLSFTLSFALRHLPGVGWLAAQQVDKELFNELLQGKFGDNILMMLRDELSTLTEELPRKLLAKWGVERNRLFCIYAASDPYVSTELQRSVRYCVEDPYSKMSSVLSVEEICHTFPLHESQSKVVIELIEEWLSSSGFSPSRSSRKEITTDSGGDNNKHDGMLNSAWAALGCPRRGKAAITNISFAPATNGEHFTESTAKISPQSHHSRSGNSSAKSQLESLRNDPTIPETEELP